MRKKRANDTVSREKKARPSAGSVIGTIIRSIAIALGFVLKIIFKALTLFGLWIPIAYSLFGVALYLIFHFNPFIFDTAGTLYLCGGIACVLGSAIISVKNVIIKPVKSIYEGYKHPLWEKVDENEKERKESESRYARYKRIKKEEKFAPPEIEAFVAEGKQTDYGDLLAPLSDFNPSKCESEASRLDWLPKNIDNDIQNVKIVATPTAEKPEVYFSVLEKDVLVHEYSDRFELFKVEGHKTIPIGVEYKQ